MIYAIVVKTTGCHWYLDDIREEYKWKAMNKIRTGDTQLEITRISLTYYLHIFSN